MTAINKRILVRWLHIVIAIPIIGYVYSPFEAIPDYAPLVRFIFLPLMVLNQTDKFPLTVGLSQWNKLANAGGVNVAEPLYPLVITGALIAILPLCVAFMFLQRYWQSGIAAGGVKQ